MKTRGAISLLAFSFLLSCPASAQELQSGTSESRAGFYLIPLVETAFSGGLRWRPDWPADIPPDAFYLREGGGVGDIELSGAAGSFTVKRDSEGRLVEFPFFLEDGYVKVQAVYAEAGALETMNVSRGQGGEETGQAEEQVWNVSFPVDFFPYSEISLGGSFPPATVASEDSLFYVFFFESPAFLTETWYDSEGEMLVFCKAPVDRENASWRVKSFQLHDADGPRFEDYFFDSDGNITEIRLQEGAYSAFYRDRYPVYWKRRDGRQAYLQWDAQGLLTVIQTAGTGEEAVEYRYEYERDYSGNWARRLETAFTSRDELLIPTPSLSRGLWSRRIHYADAGYEPLQER